MTAASGSVVTQAVRMARITPRLSPAPAPPRAIATPKIEPTDTWVVETGNPGKWTVSTAAPMLIPSRCPAYRSRHCAVVRW